MLNRLYGMSKVAGRGRTTLGRAVVAAGLAIALAGCQDDGSLSHGRAFKPIPSETLALMEEMGTSRYSPVLLRAFKKESELEVWKMKADGTYGLLKTYPMCRWSGQLGPKKREGDRQVPEGFYSITQKHMNPNSAFYLSFNIGYPNAYDRAHGRTGSLIMVHGACSSRGCFAMTDEQISEIYAIVRESFSGGQKAVQLQSLPFRMTPENLAKHRLDKNIGFWKKLKEGADHFEVSKREPSVMVCGRQYHFNATPANASARVTPTEACPPIQRDEAMVAAVQRKHSADQAKVAALVTKGVRPVRIVYADGGQHQRFAHVSMVSRPDALASAPVEIALDDSGRPLKSRTAPRVEVATAKTEPAKPQTPVVAVQRPAAGTTPVARDTSPVLPPSATAYTAAPATKSEQPLLRRWFGGLGGFTTGASPAKSPAATSQQSKPPPDPERKAQTSTLKPDKRAFLLPEIIRGAQQPLPAGFSAYAPWNN